MTQEQLKKTPLFSEHQKLHAKMVGFGGWHMPIQYVGIIEEHHHVRNQVGIFDVSHMGEFFVSGPDALGFLNGMTTNDLNKLQDGQCQYNILCQENGGVVDDIIVCRLAPDNFLVVVNAGNIQKDFSWLMQHKPDTVDLIDASDDWAMLALQGPQSDALMQAFFNEDFSAVPYFGIIRHSFKNAPLFISRTGYTGERGFEIFVPSEYARDFWNKIFEVGSIFNLQPIGLGARDTLRLEACYSLYGHELLPTISPLEADLSWVVKLQKNTPFVGKDFLLEQKRQGVPRQLIAFEMMEAGIARQDCRVFASNVDVGYVTSGTYSPTLQKSIGLALIDAETLRQNKELFVEVRQQMKQIKKVAKPFYKRPT